MIPVELSALRAKPKPTGAFMAHDQLLTWKWGRGRPMKPRKELLMLHRQDDEMQVTALPRPP